MHHSLKVIKPSSLPIFSIKKLISLKLSKLVNIESWKTYTGKEQIIVEQINELIKLTTFQTYFKNKLSFHTIDLNVHVLIFT